MWAGLQMQQSQQNQQLRLQQFAPATGVPLRGTVTDATGAAVALRAASWPVRSQSTGDTVRTSTNNRGEFLAQQIPGDQYQLSVSAAGFRSESVNGAVPANGTPAPVNVRLDAGAAADSLTVQAQAAAQHANGGAGA